MGEIGSGAIRRLWKRPSVRRFAFLAGLVLELVLVGFTLGWTLSIENNPRAVTARAHAPHRQPPAAPNIADRDAG